MKQQTLQLLTKFLKSELISGSFYVFLGSMFGNVLAFILNLFLVRYLPYGKYAEISALISFITLLSIPTIAFLPTIVQFAGRYFAKNEEDRAVELFWQSSIKIGIFTAIFFILICLFSFSIANFLHIKNVYEIILSGFVVAAMYVTITNTAFLQSLLKFQFLSFTISLGGVFKLLLSVCFLFAGFGIMGVLWAYFLAFFIPFLLTFLPLRFMFLKKFKKSTGIHTKEIFLYGLPATVAVFSLSSFTSTDILLVKHFFPNTIAASYSGLSLIGRIIFYFSAPISTVMFPLVIKKFHLGENTKHLLFMSFSLVLAASLGITLVYTLFPNLVITLILGKRYLSVAPLLGWFGLYLSIFSLLNVFVNFFLSIKKTNVSYFIATGAVLQIIGIIFFHGSIAVVVAISLILSLVLFLTLLLYYQHIYDFQKES